MKERPILFSGSMVRAILAGKKTQTRRVFKSNGGKGWQMGGCYGFSSKGYTGPLAQEYLWGAVTSPTIPPCPYGAIGDRLWVRETWNDSHGSVLYRADGESLPCRSKTCHWRPSIHMPRWASRILLEITGVRVERVQDISEADAMAEGIQPVRFDDNPLTAKLYADAPPLYPAWSGTYFCQSARESYQQLWDSINGKKYPWNSNVWVWVLSFRVVASTPGETTS